MLEHTFVELSVVTMDFFWPLITITCVVALLLLCISDIISKRSCRIQKKYATAAAALLLFPIQFSTAQELETCEFSKAKECISNPQQYPDIYGELKRQKGWCTTMGSSYVDAVTDRAIPYPPTYFPTSVDDAYHVKKMTNRVSEWSRTNQEDFKNDCPALEGKDLLCCTEDQFESMHSQVKMLSPECDACRVNLRNLWCQSTCSPDNSLFLHVNQFRKMKGDEQHKGEIFHAVEHMTYYVGEDMSRDLYEFCRGPDTFFNIICPTGKCTTPADLFSYMGRYQLGSLGSPLGFDFRMMSNMTDTEQQGMCSCDSFKDEPQECFRPMDTRLESCSSCGANCLVSEPKRKYTEACYGDRKTEYVDMSGQSDGLSSKIVQELWNRMAALEKDKTDYTILNYILLSVAVTFILIILIVFVYSKRNNPYVVPSIDLFDLSPISIVDTKLSLLMSRWGGFVSRGKNPIFIILIGLSCIIAMSFGLTHLETETEPVKLWVAESSTAFKNRDKYGQLFTPFYRTEQVIMIPKDHGVIGREEYLEEAIRLQEVIGNLRTKPYNSSYPDGISLQDICWKATGTACTVNSVTQYFQNRMEHFQVYKKAGKVLTHFENCLESPTTTTDSDVCREIASQNISIPESMKDCSCFADYGAPMELYKTYLGGIPEQAESNPKLLKDSKAIISTALVYNKYSTSENDLAIAWEREFIQRMTEENEKGGIFDLSFMAETSIEDEIERQSKGDVLPAILSYGLMLLYVTFGLGKWTNTRKFFVAAKFTIGFLGVILIVFSVVCTFGIFSWFGAKVQLVILEVVPFLALAIGVDNIFLIVHAVDRAAADYDDTVDIETKVSFLISKSIGEVGPSIVMASVAESTAFVFGCISPMPAVLWFAAFSSAAVVMNLIFQLTIFLAIVALDKRREFANRPDVLCCFQVRALEFDVQTTDDTPLATEYIDVSDVKPLSMADRAVHAYAILLSRPVTKVIVLISWIIWVSLSLYSAQSLDQGLPQDDAMPSSSYMVDYFMNLNTYLETGPPIYFVVESGYKSNAASFDFENESIAAHFCSSESFCYPDSIPTLVRELSNQPNVSRISPGVMYSWMDKLWLFANPEQDECCRLDESNRFIPVGEKASNAKTCLEKGTSVPPIPKEDFMSIMTIFSSATASPECSSGGGSIFQGQFSIDKGPVSIKDPRITYQGEEIGSELSAFTYMTLSEPCRTQSDFITTYQRALNAAEAISETSGVQVWTYSIFFAFFDQYLTITVDTYKLVGFALTAIFMIHLIYFMAFWIPFVVIIMICSVCVCVVGLMQPFGIMLNGLSLVNLIIAAGISVEFCSHFARSFAASTGNSNERMMKALHHVMLSVLFGITITKVVGLSALTLADSRIFQKYYFRMYMAIILCGLVHGLLILPVFLSFWPVKKSSGKIKSFNLRESGTSRRSST